MTIAPTPYPKNTAAKYLSDKTPAYPLKLLQHMDAIDPSMNRIVKVSVYA